MTEKISLTELQLIIKDSLYLSMPGMYWVTAEIAEIKENFAGHCYLELIDKQSDEKNIRARIKAIIWSNRYSFLRSFFENITGQPLREGLKILVKVKIEYHQIYGLSLIISDIDPAFTIGDMAMKRQMIIKRLGDEGIFDMNKEVEFPVLTQRIAIISSKNAAGYTDFINHLKGNSYGYVFFTALFESAMQGADTEADVVNALYRISENIELFDAVAIIRGGGSQTDLSWFDNYNIAYHVTQFPLPVLTGIGHEKDQSVTDMVAYLSLKTPTAVADFLVNSMSEAEGHLTEMSDRIIEKSRIIIETYRTLLESDRMKLIPVATLMISEFKALLSGNIIELINTGKELISKAARVPSNQLTRLTHSARSLISGHRSSIDIKKQNLKSSTIGLTGRINVKIQGLENSLGILSPENVLKRGYTITSLNGKIIKQSALLKDDDLIDTIFRDGTVKSRVTGTGKPKGN